MGAGVGDSVRTSVLARGLAVALLMSTAAVLHGGAPATAAPHDEAAEIVQIGYTDSAHPRTAYDRTDRVDLPLGAWADEAGDPHISRVYVTFDLTPFDGRKVTGGLLAIDESRAAACPKRAIEVWQTRPVRETPTWRSAPREVRKVGEALSSTFCPALLTFDVDDAVAQAAAEGKPRITFALRVPRALESDPSYGRHLSWFRTASLSVEYNTAPRIDDTSLRNGGFPCREQPPSQAIGGFSGHLQAVGTDADPNDSSRLRYAFAIWPVDEPSARIELSAQGTSGWWATGQVPDGHLVDGRTYAWQVRVSDGVDTSPWSKVCQYVVDRTAPPAPAVTSSNYPRSETGESPPPGEPGEFTFSGGGDPDVAGFEYGWNALGVTGCETHDLGELVCSDPFDSPRTVRADEPGGTATVRLSPPNWGPARLVVRSIDRAGLRSASVEYEFFVRYGGNPEITLVGTQPRWGDEVTLRLSPGEGVHDLVEYTYRINSTEPRTVAPAADGSATISFLAESEWGDQVTAWSRSANGFVSLETTWSVSFDPWPGVSSNLYKGFEPTGGVGVPGTFTFTPPTDRLGTETVAYRYTFDGEPPVTVPADSDRSATITWAPKASGYTAVSVVAITATGAESYEAYYDFNVA